MRIWQLQDAKARLSELVKMAEKEGPQGITVHGCLTSVMISSKEYARLKKLQGGFVSFMRQSPLYGVEVNLNREQTPIRETCR